MTNCKNPQCDDYPYYGVAPHECYWRKPGGFDNPLGTSTISPWADWPDNFFAHLNETDKLEVQFSWGLCGVYVCPECGSKDFKHSGWSKKRVLAALAEEQR